MKPVMVSIFAFSVALALAAGEPEPYDLSHLDTLEVVDADTVLGASVIWADSLLGDDECRAAFKKETGKSLDDIGKWAPTVYVAYPHPWPFPDLIAVTTCTPPQMSFDIATIHALGVLWGSASLIHELAHIATCTEYLSGNLSLEKNEKQAERVEEVCAWKGGRPTARGPVH